MADFEAVPGPTPPFSLTHMKATPARPFLKWAGGKTQLLEQIRPHVPNHFNRYFEPFLGSAAVYFAIEALRDHPAAVLSDSNPELVNCFRQVQAKPEQLLRLLKDHQAAHGATHYKRVRATRDGTPLERAARFIYLNKTCFNGLWRVNSSGQFNVPMGRYARPPIHAPELIRRASAALLGAAIKILDFESAMNDAARGDFLYLDPPYVPLSKTASFTSYTKGGFGGEEQCRLASLYRKLDKRGCLLMLSNSDTPSVRQLYDGFRLIEVRARRAINCNGSGRGHVGELLVLNYGVRYARD